jgi:ribonuclease P protein component
LGAAEDGPLTLSMRFTFRAHERLRLPADFARARRQGRKRVGRFLVVWTYGRPESPPRAARLGISVGRRSGGAVQRNLFKRRIREIFRLDKARFARGWDFVVAPRLGQTPGGFPPPFDALRADLLSLAGAPGARSRPGPPDRAESRPAGTRPQDFS